MIELLSKERCTGCNLCVRICPTNVFAAVDGDIPVLARPESCQTCFMCELYCPVDALYVSPYADRHVDVDETALVRENTLGSYSREMGWQKAKPRGAGLDPTFRFRAAERDPIKETSQP
jgi:NAD-dependent dihydropyrimidine dehydrogenase PreA subunit